MGTLEGKVAVVAGGATGIGRVTAGLLASEGAKVVVGDIKDAGAKATAEEIRATGAEAIGIQVDVSDEAAVAHLMQSAVDAWGRLDILHNNAAPLGLVDDEKPIHLEDVAVWDGVFAVIARGTFLGCKHAIPHMIASGGGAIVNTSSGASLTGAWTKPAYGASKAAVNSITKAVATRYGADGIRCNAIAPGFVLNPEVRELLPAEMRDRFCQDWLDITLVDRVGRPEDIARAVLFFVTDDADFITGQVLPIDGGLSAYGPWAKIQNDDGYVSLNVSPTSPRWS